MSVIWSGITEEGAVVPVQVTEEGKVVAVGDGPQGDYLPITGGNLTGDLTIDTDKITQDAIALLQQFGQDEDFSPEERKTIKRTLAAQFNHLGFDLEKALAPAEGLGRNPEQPIPMQQWAQGMEKGKAQNAGTLAKAGGKQP